MTLQPSEGECYMTVCNQDHNRISGFKPTDAQIDAAVREYNATSRGQIQQEEFVTDSGFIINALSTAMSEYSKAISQLLTNQTAIQNLGQEDQARILRMFSAFEETYLKDQEIILRGTV